MTKKECVCRGCCTCYVDLSKVKVSPYTSQQLADADDNDD